MDFFGLFDRKPKSGKIAKNRLQLVLYQDRMHTSPKMLEMLKADIIKVLAKYVDIDQEELDISLSKDPQGDEGNIPALVANIPIKGWKREAKG